MAIFGPWNVHRCADVWDVERRRKLGEVLRVDTTRGEVVRAHAPLRLEGDEIATYTERFNSIYPIYGGELMPQSFHCYGPAA